ncbi:hypothetical protein L9F63_009894 [Diploptera punctata]|uniref:Cytochrome b5 heme-binding domain-containing protein n=1 Tax=Diploptera punctata TaxID=6984 RepID=A0AAD8AIV1_DIPPU|nr:hypothetical protein L9F63_009894 [Diploptera punctata]
MFIRNTAFIVPIFLTIITILYLHEYNTTTFIQITSYFPHLRSLIIEIYAAILKLFGKGLKSSVPGKGILFTEEELNKYSKLENGLYLAILGKVYDVGNGEKYYGSEGGYHYFTGRDASRAFVTGDFTESGLTDDVTGLAPQELLSLEQWTQFYQKEYKYKGKLIGRYYNPNGQPTPYNREIRKLIREAKNNKEESNKEKLLYPPCNAEWSQESGSRVWCSTMSGGIQRDWIGVPRQLYEPGSKSFRCACINESQLNGLKKGNMKEYPDCNPKATSCWVYPEE